MALTVGAGSPPKLKLPSQSVTTPTWLSGGHLGWVPDANCDCEQVGRAWGLPIKPGGSSEPASRSVSIGIVSGSPDSCVPSLERPGRKKNSADAVPGWEPASVAGSPFGLR